MEPMRQQPSHESDFLDRVLQGGLSVYEEALGTIAFAAAVGAAAVATIDLQSLDWGDSLTVPPLRIYAKIDDNRSARDIRALPAHELIRHDKPADALRPVNVEQEPVDVLPLLPPPRR